MKRTLLIWACLFVLAASPTVCRAQVPVPSAPESLDPEALDLYLLGRSQSHDSVGLSVAVARNGNIIFAKGYGTTAVKDGVPVNADTEFAIGSVTKQFACACILLLAEEGKLSVRDRVAKYFPDLTRAGDISLYHLMTHTSGYPDYYPLDFLDRRMKQSIAPDELIRQYAGGKLDFEPGSRWSYSNTGYIILGRVVEKVSGESFAEFVRQRILQPCGMSHSAVEPAIDGRSVARGHASFLLGPVEVTPLEASGWLQAAGGLFASASDIARWDLALASGKVLKPDSFSLMIRPRELSSGKTQDYGCGLAITRQAGNLILTHGGAVSGYHAYNSIIPRTKSAVVVLSNSETADAAAIHRELLMLLLKEQSKGEQSIPKVDAPSAKDAASALFKELQTGHVDRAKLGDEYSLYLSDERLREAAPRLKAFGEPKEVELDGTSERGGMEVSRLKFLFANDVSVKANMFRSRDGKIQQFLLSKGD